MGKPQILIGCDPEVFVRNPNTGSFVSAYGLIPGTKQQPHMLEYAPGAIQVDGNALEFNTYPAKTCDEFVKNVTSVFSALKSFIPGYDVVIEPSVIFEPGYFSGLPDEAKALGCDPDFNAWGNKVNKPPIRPADNLGLCTASGHLHIGWRDPGALADIDDPNHVRDCLDVVTQLDYYIGIWSLYWDKDSRRRKLYGKAGAHRKKPYGVEYRVPSNAWLRSEALMRYVYNNAVIACDQLYAGNRATDHYGNVAQGIIDQGVYDWPNTYHVSLSGVETPPEGSWSYPPGEAPKTPVKAKVV